MLVALALAACAKQPVRVASKDFIENQILAEMFALQLEQAGLPVDRHIPFGETATVFEALRTGAIDVYPEYTGTGLELLGLPPSADGEQARARLAEEVNDLGITVLDPLGFESTYAVVVEKALAQERGLADVADLARVAPEMRLAVAAAFARRPEVGLQAFLDRYGLRFKAVETLLQKERRSVYDRLLDDRADVVIGFGTDPEIAAYGLTVLKPSGDFFPSYAAVPVAGSMALERHAKIRTALGRLSGRLGKEDMRRLNNAAAIDGRSPREVAREHLAALGLLQARPPALAAPFRIAVDPAEIGNTMTNKVLRAARRSFRSRGVEPLETQGPVGAMLDRRARVALTPSVAQFDIDGDQAHRIEGLETIAAVGSYYVHALAGPDGPVALAKASRIAAGPAGTPSHKLASAIASSGDPPAEIVALDSTGAAPAVAAVKAGTADAAIVLAPLGSADLIAALKGDQEVRLIAAGDWWVGATRVALPFLRQATIPDHAYDAAAGPVATLAMQATVVGPAPPTTVLGTQGPSTFSEDRGPVTDRVVLAFNRHLGPHPDIGRYLRSAAALTPRVRRIERTLNRAPGYTALSVGIMLFLCWAGWLLVRPAPTRRPK